MTSGPRPRWIVAAVFAVVVMITWTVVVKYLVPLLYGLALAHSNVGVGEPPPALAGAGVMWDLWPLTHFALAVGLWHRHRLVWAYGVGLCIAESAVVTVKFVLFLRAPEWTLWKLLWFTNKIYVLIFFLSLLYLLLGPGKRDLQPEAAS